MTILLLGSMPSFAQMYKCKDASGVTQYTDKPCPDGKGKEVDIRGQPPISGKVTPYREDLKRSEQDFERRQSQKDRERQADAKALDAQKKSCAASRAELQRLDSMRHPADSVAHDAKVASLNANIARNCR